MTPYLSTPRSIAIFIFWDRLHDLIQHVRSYFCLPTHLITPSAGTADEDNSAGEDLDMGRYLAFVLSLYFGVVSVHSFLEKVKGNAFLMKFSSIKPS